MRVTTTAGESLLAMISRFRGRYAGPRLIYDLDRIGGAARALALIGTRTGVGFIGAAKALPFDELLEQACRAFDGFDVSNCGELTRLASWRRRGGKTDALRYVAMSGPGLNVGPSKPSKLAERLTVNIESVAQLEQFDQLARWGVAAELGLRIGQPLYRNAGPTMTRFGFTETETDVIKCLARHPRFAGFHCHIDGDQAKANSHLEALGRLVEMGSGMGINATIYNLGGGFRGQTLKEIAVLCARARALVPSDVSIVFEPGGWLTAQGGYGFCRVLSMRHRPDLEATLVTVDLSRDAHCRWSTLRLAGWWGPLPQTRRLLFFGPTAYEGDYLGTFEWTGDKAGTATGRDKGFALFSGVTGYAASFNADFNGIGKAKVVTIGNVGTV
jgi:diaminopimelate decarboxylase